MSPTLPLQLSLSLDRRARVGQLGSCLVPPEIVVEIRLGKEPLGAQDRTWTASSLCLFHFKLCCVCCLAVYCVLCTSTDETANLPSRNDLLAEACSRKDSRSYRVSLLHAPWALIPSALVGWSCSSVPPTPRRELSVVVVLALQPLPLSRRTDAPIKGCRLPAYEYTQTLPLTNLSSLFDVDERGCGRAELADLLIETTSRVLGCQPTSPTRRHAFPTAHCARILETV